MMPNYVDFPPIAKNLSAPPSFLGESGDLDQPIVAWAGHLDNSVPLGPCNHPWAHLVFCFDGGMRVEIGDDRWFIPDRHGIWIPPETQCQITTTSLIEFQSFYIHSRYAANVDMPEQPTVVRATPLIRGIARRLAPQAKGLLTMPERQRLEWVALDEIPRLEQSDLCLPGARDPRVAAAITHLLSDPANAGNLARLADQIGTSERTLGRLFQTETGLNWREWRDRMRFLLALEGLQKGLNSKSLAVRLGYSSPSAFTAAFRRRAGMSPSQWRRHN
ncbi:helix-turn-helix domain-containing protein [Cohaesibacter celericrescens]|uniref:HTH araC/xylS-type domain-containing protein n=1 Tax=Cohaesibacter celericrescens TaxID=2067669 RepID=A0A2N5XWY1_9HYPH|nr:helix-turn-helix transcriptional regulator [Cohaesibacter celericrescens]PLW79002.1 hypothetical protein C0081_01835 [Cohaesibacter celericrescens]